MPAIEDWLNCPLNVVQKLFEQNCSNVEESAGDFFMQRLKEKGCLAEIPSLNGVPLHYLPANSFVKFRCMIQDMFDPEFYLGSYEVLDKKSGTKRMMSGYYRDVACCEPDEELIHDSPKNTTCDRQTYYCVPIPGETPWVKQLYSQNNKITAHASTSSSLSRNKRSLDEECGSPAASLISSTCSTLNGSHGSCTPPFSPSSNASDGTETDTNEVENKRSKVEDIATPSPIPKSPNLNFPLPDETGPACLVKIYKNIDLYKVNDMIEVYGILSIDPNMAVFNEDHESESPLLSAHDPMEVEELHAHSPPPSLVPRLHALVIHPVDHINPLIPQHLKKGENNEVVQQLISEAKSVREELVTILEQALFGDRLAAEYTIMHLLSSVYNRRDEVMALGKFSLNLLGCPSGSDYASYLENLLRQLVTHCYLLPMSLEFMNLKPFSPKKDYTANRLQSGLLQLSKGFHLMIDEMALKPGQLDATGVKNVTALGNVISWQKVEIDFTYHIQDFPCDIAVLIVSEGKSLLPADCHVKLITNGASDDLYPRFEAINKYLTPALLSKIRTYITILKLVDYQIGENVQKIIEEDFVDARRQDVKSMSVDDFHHLLVVARLLSLSYGETTLSTEVWQMAKTLENDRKARF